MMKTEQKNTKKIVVIIVAVLAILLAVAGLTFWSVHVYRANNDPQPSGVTESGGESLLGSKPAGEESHTPSKNGNALNPAPSRRAASKTEQILFLTLVSQRKSWAS